MIYHLNLYLLWTIIIEPNNTTKTELLYYSNLSSNTTITIPTNSVKSGHITITTHSFKKNDSVIYNSNGGTNITYKNPRGITGVFTLKDNTLLYVFAVSNTNYQFGISESEPIEFVGTGNNGQTFSFKTINLVSNTQINHNKGEHIYLNDEILLEEGTLVDLQEGEYLYCKLPDRSYTPGNQHSTYATATITINSTPSFYLNKYITILDYKQNEITYQFVDESINNTGLFTDDVSNASDTNNVKIGVNSLSTLETIAEQLKNALNHTNGHGSSGLNTIDVNLTGSTINLTQKISGEIGNKTMKWKIFSTTNIKIKICI